MEEGVIKVLNPEHGQRVLEYFALRGCNTRGYGGHITIETNGVKSCCYYGVINGKFENYSLKEVMDNNIEIIDL